MAKRTVKVEIYCPRCGAAEMCEFPREWLNETDNRGNARLSIGTYVFWDRTIKESTKHERTYHPCHNPECNGKMVVFKIHSTAKQGIQFCKKCGAFIDPRIAGTDELCDKCDGITEFPVYDEM